MHVDYKGLQSMVSPSGRQTAGDLRGDQLARSNPTGKDGLASAAGDAAGQPKKHGNKFKLAAAEERQRGHDASAANRIGGAEDATAAAEARYRPTA